MIADDQAIKIVNIVRGCTHMQMHRIGSDRIGTVGMSGESTVLFAKQQEQQ